MSEEMQAVLRELNISDYDDGNPREKMFLGIITKLRAKRREIEQDRDELRSKHDALEQEVSGYRRSKLEGEIISKALGDKLEITEANRGKFDRWKAKLGGGTWEADLADLVKDFATEKDSKDAKDSKDQGGDGAGGNKPVMMQRTIRGNTQKAVSSEVLAPKSPSGLLRLATEDPEGYAAYRAAKDGGVAAAPASGDSSAS